MRVILLALLLTACDAQDAANGQAAKREQSREDRKSAELALVRAKVAEVLKDPSSAQFRNVRRIKLGVAGADPWASSGQYCGEVNGKNSFGAYSGFTPFFAWGPDSSGKFDDNPVHLVDDSNPASQMAYLTFCLDEKQRPVDGIPVTL